MSSNVQIAILGEIESALRVPAVEINFQTSFLENGGDSLSCLALQSTLRKLGIVLSFETIATTESIQELLSHVASKFNDASCSNSSKRKPATPAIYSEAHILKRTRTQWEPVDGSKSPDRIKHTISLEPDAQTYPLTSLQLVFLNSSLVQSERNIIQYRETHLPERTAQLKKAWRTAFESESIFRMRFDVGKSGGCMVDTGRAHFQWTEIEVATLADYENEVKKADWNNCVEDGFPVNSFKVVKLRDKSTVIWRIHHALIDEYSRNLLLAKVQRYLDGAEYEPGPCFGRFAMELRVLQSQLKDKAKDYWAAQQPSLALSAAALALPKPTTMSPTALGNLEFTLDVSRVDHLCKHLKISVAAWYCAAWALVLSRYAGSEHVCFGVIWSGRAVPIRDTEHIIGPTINSLPFHVHLDRGLSSEQLLRRVFQSLTELSSFQWSYLDVEDTKGFDTALNIQLTREASSGGPLGSIEPPSNSVTSDVPLQVDVALDGRVSFSYHTDIFSQYQMSTIAETFSAIVSGLQTAQPVLDCGLPIGISDEQMDRLSRMGNWNSAFTFSTCIKTNLVQLFAEAAQKNPSNVAVSRGCEYLTYAELDRKSTLVALKLSDFINKGDVVCVQANQTIHWIIAIYGVLKAGGIYCPFADDMPPAARDTNYQTANAKVFLAGTEEAKVRKPLSCDKCLSIEGLLSSCAGKVDAIVARYVAPEIDPDAPAYLCFTSGSTGKPKGVLCRHRGLVAFQSNLTVRLFARPRWKIAQIMSPNFDGSIHEIFSALCYGAELVLRSGSDPFAHLAKVNAAILTPSVAKVLSPGDHPQLNVLYLVGEVVPQALSDTWTAEKRVFNMYGPTEATCGATIKELEFGKPVTLGSPNPTTRVYILDRDKKIVPPGVLGEIFLAGVQVAAGYIGRPDETANRFVHDTVQPHLDEYMYRTGDRGYWGESGELIFLGRNDRQIKYRGFRIDLDDLEVRMLQCCVGLKAAAVALQKGNLVAQVQPSNVAVRELYDQLKKNIPTYSIPLKIVAVDAFPLTSVGKLDYTKIAAHDYYETQVGTGGDTQSSLEKILSTAIRDVFGLPQDAAVNLDATFAELGGHSVLHLRLSHRLSKLLGVPIPLGRILQAPTLRNLANSLDFPTPKILGMKNEVVNNFDACRLSPIEMDWWAKYQIGASSSFNVSFACELDPAVNSKRLAAAWNTLLDRHKILRSYYRPCGTFGVRRDYHQKSPRVQLHEVIDVSQESNAPIDIERELLIRVLVSPQNMLVVISHIICDLTTLRALLEELTATYFGHPSPAIHKTYSQIEWYTPNSSSQLPFWAEYLCNQPKLKWPTGNTTKRKTWAGTSRVCEISPAILTQMRSTCAVRKCTMHQLAMAAVALALQHDLHSTDITLGAPYLNRHSEDDQNVIGLFLEPLPIRIKYDPSRPGGAASFIDAVQHSSQMALSHAVPWHEMLAYLQITPVYPENPIFDVMVTLHDECDGIDVGIPGTRPMRTWTEGAKFKIMAEFSADRQDRLSLRLEYSTECFGGGEMEYLERLVCVALEGLAGEEEYDDIRARLGAIGRGRD